VRLLGTPDKVTTSSLSSSSSGATLIPVKAQGGTYVVPVLINKAITLNFVIDSGAADVSIPADVVLTLVRSGTVLRSDFIGTKTYRLADGSTVPSTTFRIRSLTVGNNVVIENVTGSIAPVRGDLLLGQSFLSRFKSWSIDNAKQAFGVGSSVTPRETVRRHLPSVMPARRFPPPWSVEQQDACFVVRDHDWQPLAYVYFPTTGGERYQTVSLCVDWNLRASNTSGSWITRSHRKPPSMPRGDKPCPC
jgi:hypothetical protein